MQGKLKLISFGIDGTETIERIDEVSVGNPGGIQTGYCEEGHVIRPWSDWDAAQPQEKTIRTGHGPMTGGFSAGGEWRSMHDRS